MIISTGNRSVENAIRQAAIAAGIDSDRIYTDIIPQDIVRMGYNADSDTFMFLHRLSLTEDPVAEAAYYARPPVEVLRITPKVQLSPNPLNQPPLRPRGTGVDEKKVSPELSNALDQLRNALILKYAKDKKVTELNSSLWLVEGNEAIEKGINVIGETRDTLYTRTDDFAFNENDLVVVYGVDHHQTGKAVYANFSCYGSEYFNGIGGIDNFRFQGTAAEYLPNMDPEITKKLYVWKFARHAFDEHTYIVIDYGDNAFIGFRAYIDVTTLVGTTVDEIIPDRVLVFSPK